MAHVADHRSFDTLADLERAVTERCLVLDSDQLKSRSEKKLSWVRRL